MQMLRKWTSCAQMRFEYEALEMEYFTAEDCTANANGFSQNHQRTMKRSESHCMGKFWEKIKMNLK